MNNPPPDVEEFLAALPEPKQSALRRLREVILTAAPEATERIGYGVPAFYHNNRALVSYSAARNHCSFFVQSPEVMAAHADLLKGYDTSKGTVRFQPDDPLPDELVHTLVRARIEEIEARAR